MQLTAELRETIIDRINKDEKIMIFALAKELGVPELAIMECLPESECVLVGTEHFEEIMTMIATWGQVTTIVQNGSVVLETKGMLPLGSFGYGYFNLMGKGDYNVGGHIRADLLSAIYFVERPFMGMRSMSVQFYELSGAPMFKVYIGRDEKRQLLPEQIEAFEALRDRVAGKTGCGCRG